MRRISIWVGLNDKYTVTVYHFILQKSIQNDEKKNFLWDIFQNNVAFYETDKKGWDCLIPYWTLMILMLFTVKSRKRLFDIFRHLLFILLLVWFVLPILFFLSHSMCDPFVALPYHMLVGVLECQISLYLLIYSSSSYFFYYSFRI
jgi:hypothetical protein